LARISPLKEVSLDIRSPCDETPLYCQRSLETWINWRTDSTQIEHSILNNNKNRSASYEMVYFGMGVCTNHLTSLSESPVIVGVTFFSLPYRIRT